MCQTILVTIDQMISKRLQQYAHPAEQSYAYARWFFNTQLEITRIKT